MGGGDLNLKKSWHPQTMKNQERVWKAEQAKNEETRKLNDLRKEIEEERNREDLKRIGENSGVLAKSNNDAKLEWMYKSSNDLINRDEYLLGRKIDKSFETLQAEEEHEKNVVGVKKSINHVEHECVPFSIREFRNIQSTEQVDLQRKTMEDPLMLIKQRELESRRKLLENPVKLKEIHRILKTEQTLRQSSKTKKTKKKSAKKFKKKKKKRSDSTSDSDSGSESDKDLDRELEKRYKKLQGNTVDLSLTKLLDIKYKTISKELDKATKSKSKKSKRRSSSNSDRSSSSSSEGSQRQRKRIRQSPDERRNTRRDSRSRRRSRSKSISKHSSRKEQSEQQKHQRMQRERAEHDDRHSDRRSRQHKERTRSPDRQRKSNRRNRSRSRNRSYGRDTKSSRRPPSRSRTPNTIKRQQQPQHQEIKRKEHKNNSPPRTSTAKATVPPKTKLTDAERADRLREMVNNAAWRESDRTESVQKHREAYAREEAQNKSHDFDKEFINKEVKKAIATQDSIGSRIRSNLNNIQRASGAMDSNFARK